MQLVGINVITRTEVEECFAVIDDEIVWHGGMNLLGKADVWDNLMRIRNSQLNKIAARWPAKAVAQFSL